MEVVVAGETPDGYEAWNAALHGAGFALHVTPARLEAVLHTLGQRRPAALVVDLSDPTRLGLDLAQQIALRDEFLALPVLFLLPNAARLGKGTSPTGASPSGLSSPGLSPSGLSPSALPSAGLPTPGAPRNGPSGSYPSGGYPSGGVSAGLYGGGNGSGRDLGDSRERFAFRDGYTPRDPSSSGSGPVTVAPGAALPGTGGSAAYTLPPEAMAVIESIAQTCADFAFAPVTPYELAVRLARLVRVPETTGPAVTKAGDVEIDDRAHRVVAGGREVSLRKKEYDLLLFLMRNAGVVFTRDALLRWVWGPGFTGDARTVDVHIRRLRSKLGEEAGSIIETVRRVGYRLSAGAVANLPPGLTGEPADGRP
jgi:DNA-binding response OmpR family regulator